MPELKPGDRVTSPSWDGCVVTIRLIAWDEETRQAFAYFDEGGFWRVSQLTLVERATPTGGEA